jgi:hypothetical protein
VDEMLSEESKPVTHPLRLRVLTMKDNVKRWTENEDKIEAEECRKDLFYIASVAKNYRM